MTAAAAAVREDHHGAGLLGYGEVTIQQHPRRRYLNRA
jgi:hypothetical protein